MSDQNSFQGNLTSVWGIVRGHIDTMVDRAILGSQMYVTDDTTARGRFKLLLKSQLGDSLNHVIPGHQASQIFGTLHQEIKGAVEEAVDTTMNELNVTLTNSSDKALFVKFMDSDIEYDVYNTVYRNASEHESSFFESLSLKDETVFVALVSMGVIIPIIFFTLLIIFFYKRHRETKKRRHAMLLRDQPDLCMDEYGGDDKNNLDDGVPDLDLKYLRM